MLTLLTVCTPGNFTYFVIVQKRHKYRTEHKAATQNSNIKKYKNMLQQNHPFRTNRSNYHCWALKINSQTSLALGQ